jgi:hypothetical protein
MVFSSIKGMRNNRRGESRISKEHAIGFGRLVGGGSIVYMKQVRLSMRSLNVLLWVPGDVHSKCNEDLSPAREGFLWNPGYPDIYHGDKSCQWRLRVSDSQQKILLVFLDISLRGK